MRKAFYNYEVAPKEWITGAALIYDRIIVHGLDSIRSTGKSVDEIWPTGVISDFERESWRHILELDSQTNQPGLFEDALGLNYPSLPEIFSTGPEKWNLKDIIDFNKSIENINPEVDYYHRMPGYKLEAVLLPKDENTPERWDLTYVVEKLPEAFYQIHMVSMLLPSDTSSISTGQLIDFRNANEFRRVKFQKFANELIASFGEASTVDDMKRVVRLCELAIAEEYQKLETLYKHTKIDAVCKTIGISIAPPAMIGLLGSALGINCIEAAGITATISMTLAQILMAREKADMSIKDSPWSYLYSMKQLR